MRMEEGAYTSEVQNIEIIYSKFCSTSEFILHNEMLQIITTENIQMAGIGPTTENL